MGRCVLGKNSITCYRGENPKIYLLEDRQGNKWFSDLNEEEFNSIPPSYPIRVTDKNKKVDKSFIKSYLIFKGMKA